MMKKAQEKKRKKYINNELEYLANDLFVHNYSMNNHIHANLFRDLIDDQLFM